MKNAEIAQMFETMADIMEIRGENQFRVSSYRKVARALTDLNEGIKNFAEAGDLKDIPGIGKSSAEKIQQYLQTGSMDRYEELMEDFPGDALELLEIPDLGPKTVEKFMSEKDITSIEDLENAIENGHLEDLEGIGPKTIENLKQGIEIVRRRTGRSLLGNALPAAEEVVRIMSEKADVKRIEIAGSLRRRKETIGDIDILSTVETTENGADEDEDIPGGSEIVEKFTNLEIAAEVLVAGSTKGSIRTREDLQIDLRVVRPESFGAALQYFTGSKAHNIKIRGMARDRDLKINEYGVFDGEESIAGETEEEVYTTLDLPWIPPELREDRGEIEAAEEDNLPELITRDDIRADLHAHSDYSDGKLSVMEMARAAKDLGYEYFALTDHSQNLGVASGLSPEKLEERKKEIDEASGELNFPILNGTEADILKDGTVDYGDEILSDLDWVVASVHDHFDMEENAMTERINSAVRNPNVHVIGHLTGRLIEKREPYRLDIGAVMEACAETGTALELNAHPDRLDIQDTVCRQAKEAGVKVVIGTDAHNSSHLSLMHFGVSTARRGWLTKDDVLNALSYEDFKDYLESADR